MAVDYDIDLDALLITHGGDPLGSIPMIGYIRVSTAREDMISPENQADHIHDLAKRTGCRIVLWVADLDLSGRTLAKRQISGIIEGVAAGVSPEGAKRVGVWKYSRFGRNRADNQLNLALLERHGGELVSATEQVDASTAVGRLTRGVLFELASFESDLIGEGWRDAHAYRVARGLPHDGRPRFGYERLGRIQAGGTWVVDPEDGDGERYSLGDTSPQYARMYREAAASAPILGIAKWLNEGSVPSGAGAVGTWTVQAVYNVLDSGFGAGYLIVHDPKCSDHKPDGSGRCPNTTYVPGAHPHVFDSDAERDEVWEKYLARRAAGKKLGPRAKNAQYDMTGLIKCLRCGRLMGAQPYSGRNWYRWRCQANAAKACPGQSTSVSGAKVTVAVTRLLAREHERLAALEQSAGAHRPEKPVTQKSAVEDLQGRLDKVRGKLDRLTEKYAEGDVPKASYRRTRDKLEAEETGLVEQLKEAKKKRTRRPEEYVPIIRGLLDEWATLPVWATNGLLRELVEIEAWRVDSTEAWVKITTAWGTEETAFAAGKLSKEERAELEALRMA
jgi:DNA invertase Pin-like site-specific DNA recombinase